MRRESNWHAPGGFDFLRQFLQLLCPRSQDSYGQVPMAQTGDTAFAFWFGFQYLPDGFYAPGVGVRVCA